MGNQHRIRVRSTRVSIGVVCLAPLLFTLTASADVVPVSQWQIDALHRAADQGSVPDKAVLGNMYLHGTGVARDYEKALLWSGRAARQGGALAQHDLGYMYFHGIGVPRDYSRSAYWHRKAADQGFAPSQLGMGVMYALGQGVPQDYVLAHKWSDLAVARMALVDATGRPDPERREAAIRYRDAVAVHMTPEQLAEARRLAREWQPKAPR